jgi:hypothetical protein
MPATPEIMGASPLPRRALRRSALLERLTFLALLIGLVAAASYAMGAATALRYVYPRLGAWLDAYQYYLMEGGATAFGLIVGIRIGRRLAADAADEPQTANIALILAALAFAPLIHLCARAARFGWAGHGGVAASWIIGREGYEASAKYYRFFLTTIYFFKTAGLAVIAGLALIALTVAIVSSRDAASANRSSA